MDSDKDVKEIHSRNSLEMTISGNKEILEKIMEWAEMVPTLYFLDICVVGATKLSQKQLLANDRKREIVEKLKGLDKPQHGFSYILALLEKVNDSRGVASDAELEARILDDLAAMRSFFVNASVYESDAFAISFLRALRGSTIELGQPNYIAFLETINEKFGLGVTIAPSLRYIKTESIVALAKSLDIGYQHPVVTIVIASLYGNASAKKLLKFKQDPKKFNAENALADIMSITRFANLKLRIEEISRSGGRYANSKLITDDTGLLGIISSFRIEHLSEEKNEDDTTTTYKMKVELRKLLTEIEDEEYGKICQLLQCDHISDDLPDI